MKKLLGFLLLVAILSGPIFANGSQETAAGGEKKPVTLTLWTHEDPNRQKMEEQFAAE